jgi:uncharacterized protein YqeY
MSKKSDLEAALKDAMRANDTIRKNTLRMTLSAIKNSEKLEGKELEDAATVSILQKEVKSRQETLAESEKAGRADLADAAKAEIKVLEEFLPAQMKPEELEALVLAAISETGASSMSDMGKVVKLAMQKAEGRADGSQISQLVKSKLQT